MQPTTPLSKRTGAIMRTIKNAHVDLSKRIEVENCHGRMGTDIGEVARVRTKHAVMLLTHVELHKLIADLCDVATDLDPTTEPLAREAEKTLAIVSARVAANGGVL